MAEVLSALLKDRRFQFSVERAVKEVREQVLGDAGPYQEVYGPRAHSKDPSPLKIKEVRIEDRRYIVCCNEEQGPCGAAVYPHRARTIHVR